MIHVLDEIRLAPERLDAVLAAFEVDYQTAAQARGLELRQRWVSPPVAVPGEPNTLWLLWQVRGSEHTPLAWYGARSGQDAATGEFWQGLAGLILERRRHVLGAADAGLPGPAQGEA